MHTRKAKPIRKELRQKVSESKGKRSCGKLVFSTRKKAIKFIQRQHDTNPRAEVLREYKCRCGQYHTTSQA